MCYHYSKAFFIFAAISLLSKYPRLLENNPVFDNLKSSVMTCRVTSLKNQHPLLLLTRVFLCLKWWSDPSHRFWLFSSETPKIASIGNCQTKHNCFCFFVLSLSFQCTTVHLSVKAEVLGKITPISGAPMICGRFLALVCHWSASVGLFYFRLTKGQKFWVANCLPVAQDMLPKPWEVDISLALDKVHKISQEARATISFKLRAYS